MDGQSGKGKSTRGKAAWGFAWFTARTTSLGVVSFSTARSVFSPGKPRWLSVFMGTHPGGDTATAPRPTKRGRRPVDDRPSANVRDTMAPAAQPSAPTSRIAVFMVVCATLAEAACIIRRVRRSQDQIRMLFAIQFVKFVSLKLGDVVTQSSFFLRCLLLR